MNYLLLGISDYTIHLWTTGTEIQSQSIDNFLRFYFDNYSKLIDLKNECTKK